MKRVFQKSQSSALFLSCLFAIAAVTSACNPVGGSVDGSVSLDSVSPKTGPRVGGIEVTLKGAGFQEGDQILFDAAECTPLTVVSDSEIKCTVPAADMVGAVDVSLIRDGDLYASLDLGFTYGASVDSVTPATGPMHGGIQLTVKGSGFQSGDQISLDGVECIPLTFVSDTEITCTLPRHAAGKVDVALMSAGKQEAVLKEGFSYGCVPSSAGGLSVWANDGGDKVTLDETRATCDSASVHNSLWDGYKIKLFGAKNEVVNFNLVIEAQQNDTSNVSVKFDKLSGPSGQVIQSAATSGDGVFDWTNRNIELFYIKYLQIKGLSRISYESYDERQVPRRFQRPWVGEGTATGTWNDRPDHDKYYPDIAIPMELISTFKVKKNQNQSVWADIYIPKTVTAGLYTGTVGVYVGSSRVAEVPVELTVRDFTLPEVPTSKTMVFFGTMDIIKRYLGADPVASDTEGFARLDRIRDRHFLMAHRHKISMIDNNWNFGDAPADQPRAEWLPRLNGELFTAANGYNGPGVGKGNNIFSIGTYNSWSWTDGTESDMWAHTDAWEQWFRDNSPSTERFLFLEDEPSTLVNSQKWATWMDNNPGVGKNLPSMVATSVLQAIADAPAVDILAGLISVGDTPRWEDAVSQIRAKAMGKLYMYNGKRPASGSFATEDDGVALRELAWGQYKKGVDRWFTWESTYYNNYQGERGQTNLYKTAQTFGSLNTTADASLGASGWNYGNGDGVLFYPGTDTLYSSDAPGVDGPITSLRMKHWRRGIQDVDYIALAKAKNPTKVQKIIDRMVPKILWETGVQNPNNQSYQKMPISWSIDPNDWEQARAELADIIEGK